MPRQTVSATIACAISLGFASPTIAQNPFSCAMLASAKLPLYDGALYYTSVGSSNWAESSTENFHLLPSGQYSFAYVIQDGLSAGRAGVLVIKTGRYQTPTSPAAGKHVLMVRTESGFTKTRECPKKVGPFEQKGERVSASSYDGYHDFGYTPPAPDLDRINRFHVEYENAIRQCVATDRATSDKTFPGFWRSNRSQFSFADGVVDNGMGSQLADAARSFFGRTFGAYERFAGRRVEIRRYETEGPQPACLTFNISVSGPDHFLSVNDLERWSTGIRGLETRRNHRD